jgi:hypothetical protein
MVQAKVIWNSVNIYIVALFKSMIVKNRRMFSTPSGPSLGETVL